MKTGVPSPTSTNKSQVPRESATPAPRDPMPYSGLHVLSGMHTHIHMRTCPQRHEYTQVKHNRKAERGGREGGGGREERKEGHKPQHLGNRGRKITGSLRLA